MKKILSLLATTGLVAGSLIATAVPAQAEQGDTDIVLTSGPRVPDLVISSRTCKPIRVSMGFEAQPSDAAFDLVAASLLIWGEGNATPWEELVVADGRDRELTNTNESLEIEPWDWCPTRNDDKNISGLGRFTVTGDLLMWWDAETGLWDEGIDPEIDDIPEPTGGYEFDATTTFTVKQASKVSSAKVTKKGTKRTLSATFTYFDITKKAKKEWTALPKGTKVELQRSTRGANSWKKIKTVKVGSKGAVKTTYKTKTKYDYRFVCAGNATKAPITSKTLSK